MSPRVSYIYFNNVFNDSKLINSPSLYIEYLRTEEDCVNLSAMANIPNWHLKKKGIITVKNTFVESVFMPANTLLIFLLKDK